MRDLKIWLQSLNRKKTQFISMHIPLIERDWHTWDSSLTFFSGISDIYEWYPTI